MLRITATLIGFCLLAGGVSQGAKIISVDIKNEGPLRLAGDTLVASLLVEKGETEITLNVRAFSAHGAQSRDFAAVMAAGDQKDAEGRFLVVKKLRPEADALAPVEAEISIDAKDLNLPDGANQIQYELRVIVPGAEEHNDAAPTPIWPVHVAGGVRVLPSEESLAAQRARGLAEILEEALKPPKIPQIRVELPSETNYKRWIYFVTNRPESMLNLQKVQPFLSSHSEIPAKTLSYGVAQTNVPFDIHKKGALESGGWAGRKVQEAFTMKKPVVDYPKENFYKSLLKDDILVFVHGFNNSFEDAIVQASQLRVDIGVEHFGGKIVAFSWPAYGGNFAEYRSDGVRAERSVPAMVEFLSTLLQKNAEQPEGERRSIHLIAHSMGNRILLGALEQLVADKAQAIPPQRFGKVFLAAPDVAAGELAARLDSAALASERVTVYYSKKDLALLASEFLNRNKRGGKNPLLSKVSRGGKVDFVCTDNVNTWHNRFGHGYFAGVDRVLTDISLLLEYNLPPEERRALLMPSDEGASCWAFRAPNLK